MVAIHTRTVVDGRDFVWLNIKFEWTSTRKRMFPLISTCPYPNKEEKESQAYEQGWESWRNSRRRRH